MLGFFTYFVFKIYILKMDKFSSKKGIYTIMKGELLMNYEKLFSLIDSKKDDMFNDRRSVSYTHLTLPTTERV